jgi:predicted DNA binding CopG/RHH family protein
VWDIEERGKTYMKKRIAYTDEPMDNIKITKDFLPSPEELIFKDQTVKVTISLSKSSVDYFKQIAKSYNTQYQKMIRRLLDEYVSRQKIAS